MTSFQSSPAWPSMMSGRSAPTSRAAARLMTSASGAAGDGAATLARSGIAPCTGDGHARVHQSGVAGAGRDHRAPRELRVAVRDRDGHLLVVAQDHRRRIVPEVVDDAVVKPAE